MALQLVYLGTPNNNDGDSLYAGGTKINANFTELYTQLAGSTEQALRIDLGTPLIGDPVSGDKLEWSPLNEQFIPSSSTMLKTLGGNTNSFLALTNNSGKAGVDEDYSGQPNALELILNGRRMWNFRATTTGTAALTRGTWYIGLGNAGATSLAISTRGVTVGGIDGLTIVRNSTEEGAVSSVVAATGSSGIILYQTPIIHPDFYKEASDSSGTIINSGFVQNAISRRGFANGTSTVTGFRGLLGGGAISADQQIYLDPQYFPTFIEGFLYNIDASGNIVVQPGTCAHYSYSTTGETAIAASNPAIALIKTSTAKSRSWSATTWTQNNSAASLDSPLSATNTWFYVYVVSTTDGATVDFVVTTSRDYASTQTKLTAASGGAYKVIRRIGAFRTTANTDGSGLGMVQPFYVTREDHNKIRVEYASNDLNSTGIGISVQSNSSVTWTTFITTTVAKDVFAQGLFNSSAATTATAAHFSSQLIRAIPPLPGVGAEIAVLQNVLANPLTLYFYGEPMYSSAGTFFNAAARVPMQRIRPLAAMTPGQTSTEVRALVVSPDPQYISDATHAGTTVFGSTSGAIVRYAFVQQATGGAVNGTPNLLGWDVQGFTLAR